MNKFTPFVPTLARYGLLVLGTKLASGGWLPDHLAFAIVDDPALLEIATGIAIGATALVWFAYSKAKQAIQLVADF